MRNLHWSQILMSFVTIEVTYADGARQGWDYDCSQYATLEDMKSNMASDFKIPRKDWGSVMIYVTRNSEHYSGEIDVPELTSGQVVMNKIFEYIEEVLAWQPVEIS